MKDIGARNLFFLAVPVGYISIDWSGMHMFLIDNKRHCRWGYYTNILYRYTYTIHACSVGVCIQTVDTRHIHSLRVGTKRAPCTVRVLIRWLWRHGTFTRSLLLWNAFLLFVDDKCTRQGTPKCSAETAYACRWQDPFILLHPSKDFLLWFWLLSLNFQDRRNNSVIRFDNSQPVSPARLGDGYRRTLLRGFLLSYHHQPSYVLIMRKWNSLCVYNGVGIKTNWVELWENQLQTTKCSHFDLSDAPVQKSFILNEFRGILHCRHDGL